MTHDTFRDSLVLHLYGELAPDETARIEEHLAACPDCRAELESLRSLHRRLDARELTPPPSLGVEAREALMREVSRPSLSGRIWALLFGGSPAPVHTAAGLRRLSGAVSLVALGFVAARVSTRGPGAPGGTSVEGAGLVPPEEVVSSIRPDALGRIRIGYRTIQHMEFTGPANDDRVQDLLLRAARDEANDGLRVESISLLRKHVESERVREALLAALRGDPNPGVRLQAIDGLRAFAEEGAIRAALARTLVEDDNPGVRVQAVDLLTRRPDPEMVGVLQRVVATDMNGYVRRRCIRALRDMNASVGTF